MEVDKVYTGKSKENNDAGGSLETTEETPPFKISLNTRERPKVLSPQFPFSDSRIYTFHTPFNNFFSVLTFIKIDEASTDEEWTCHHVFQPRLPDNLFLSL